MLSFLNSNLLKITIKTINLSIKQVIMKINNNEKHLNERLKYWSDIFSKEISNTLKIDVSTISKMFMTLVKQENFSEIKEFVADCNNNSEFIKQLTMLSNNSLVEYELLSALINPKSVNLTNERIFFGFNLQDVDINNINTELSSERTLTGCSTEDIDTHSIFKFTFTTEADF